MGNISAMQRGGPRRVGTATRLCLFAAALAGMAAAGSKTGRLQGFVYGDDGRRPLKNAVVLLRETASGRAYQSEMTGKNGAYRIGFIAPGAYAVGIRWGRSEYNVDALIQMDSRKRMACFTLPRIVEQPGYQVRCSSPACFFVTPCGWALVGATTAGIAYGLVRITEKEVSPTGK